MKPKEYVKKFSPWKSEYANDAVNQLKIDFMTVYETVFILGGNKISLSRFKSLTKEAKDKFDLIRSYLPEIPEKSWGYIYATVIKPMEGQFCSEEIAQKEAKRRKQKAWESTFGGYYSNNDFDYICDLIKSILNPKVDIEAQGYLGLSDNFTREDVNIAYRALSKMAHPDCGGSHKAFLELTEMKNRALVCAV